MVEDVAGALPYVFLGGVEHSLERGSIGELLKITEVVHGSEADGRVPILQGTKEQGDSCVWWSQLGDGG